MVSAVKNLDPKHHDTVRHNRDMAVKNVFQITSLFLQVPVLVAVLVTLLIWFNKFPSGSLLWVTLALIHISVLPLLYGAYIYKTRRISNADITERSERIIPFFIVTIFYLANLLETFLFNAPEIFKILAIHFFTLALLVSIVTVFWKVSVHTAGATQFVLLLMIIFGSQALIVSPLIVLTAWLRITMKSHNIWQALGGSIAAAASFLIAAIFTPL